MSELDKLFSDMTFQAAKLEIAKLRAEIKQLGHERDAVADLYDRLIREPRQMDAGIKGTGEAKAGSQDSASH